MVTQSGAMQHTRQYWDACRRASTRLGRPGAYYSLKMPVGAFSGRHLGYTQTSVSFCR